MFISVLTHMLEVMSIKTLVEKGQFRSRAVANTKEPRHSPR